MEPSLEEIIQEFGLDPHSDEFARLYLLNPVVKALADALYQVVLQNKRLIARGIEDMKYSIRGLRKTLKMLEGWDMLTLDAEGKGVATGDAPWARNLIATALEDFQ